jgi:hypothetical protein
VVVNAAILSANGIPSSSSSGMPTYRPGAVNKRGADEFICITDIAKNKNPNTPRDIIKNWMCNKNTIELLGLWERLKVVNAAILSANGIPSSSSSGMPTYRPGVNTWLCFCISCRVTDLQKPFSFW